MARKADPSKPMTAAEIKAAEKARTKLFKTRSGKTFADMKSRRVWRKAQKSKTA
jgi:hypothetical protein